MHEEMALLHRYRKATILAPSNAPQEYEVDPPSRGGIR